ncbi:MAG TPA: cell division protein SepF [Acidimicrobiia bacterium]|nr:cell division protein SepF [Acidimicrobiia bacterium]
MASLWQKTLFYLGLVDEDEAQAASQEALPAQPTGVRTVEPPGAGRSTARAVESSGPQTVQAQPPATSAVAGRRVEPPARQRRRISSDPAHAEAGVLVRGRAASPMPVNHPLAPQCEIIEASTFTDAQALADHIRDGRPVVLDLRSTEPAMVRRLVDFATGLTYALDGRMAKTAQGVILVTPRGLTLEPAEQQRLAGLGLYRVGS